MSLADLPALLLLLAGTLFFIAGTAGLLRFPDFFTRLHALTKADNLGLGLIAAGLALRSADPLAALKLAAVWLLVVLSSVATSHLLARTALRRGMTPWRRP